MTDITNADRSAWAAEAIDAFTSVCRMGGEDNQTKAKDLATNLVHYLRLECGLSFEEASTVIHNAVNMAEQETEEDSDGDEDEPVEREYGVRLWGTFRACAETTVKAFSFDEAIEKAKQESNGFYKFEIESCEGDQTNHVFGPDDDNQDDDDPWQGDGVEIDMRDKGEPFSWDACQLVKELAQLKDKGWGSADILPLINRAAAFCTKEG